MKMATTNKRNIQLSLIQDDTGKHVTVTLHDLVPAEFLPSEEPDDNLVGAISQSWVPPILICPDNRHQADDGRQLYYPIDGKRRVKAVAYLSSINYEYQGTPVDQMPIEAILRADLCPEDENAYRLSFQANHLRSHNPLTDVSAVKMVAQNLNVDPFTKTGQIGIAAHLRVPVGVIKRLVKGLLLDESVFRAYQEGRLSTEALTSLTNLRDPEARDKAAQRLMRGESLSSKDIQAYNKTTKQATLMTVFGSQPNIEYAGGDDNPLISAISLLETSISGTRISKKDIQEAIALLKRLL